MTIAPPPDLSPSPAPATPPLSILDLMLWTFATAVTLAVQNLLPENLLGPAQRSFGVVSACLEGAAVAAALRLAMRWWRGERPMLLHPGHWLLWNAGVLSVMQWTHTYLLFWWMRGIDNDQYNLKYALASLWGYLVFVLAALLLNVLAMVAPARIPAGTGWPWFFGLRTFNCLAQWAAIVAFLLLFTWIQGSDNLGPLPRFVELSAYIAGGVWLFVDPLEFLALAAVAIHERRRGTPRDWLHFGGIAILLGLSVLASARYLTPWLVS